MFVHQIVGHSLSRLPRGLLLNARRGNQQWQHLTLYRRSADRFI